jgi:hypothetical protein
MAKEQREVSWATFQGPTRLSAQSHGVEAVTSSATTKLYKVDIDGVPHLRIEDKAVRAPGDVPWTNVASVGWTVKP